MEKNTNKTWLKFHIRDEPEIFNEDECRSRLRELEYQAYSNVVRTLRAKGDLTPARKNILEQLRREMNIPKEKHNSEILEVVNNEELNTIAERLSGPGTDEKWISQCGTIVPKLKRDLAFTIATLNYDDDGDAIEKPQKPVSQHDQQPTTSSASLPTAPSEDVAPKKCVPNFEEWAYTVLGLNELNEDYDARRVIQDAQALYAETLQIPDIPSPPSKKSKKSRVERIKSERSSSADDARSRSSLSSRSSSSHKKSKKHPSSTFRDICKKHGAFLEDGMCGVCSMSAAASKRQTLKAHIPHAVKKGRGERFTFKKPRKPRSEAPKKLPKKRKRSNSSIYCETMPSKRFCNNEWSGPDGVVASLRLDYDSSDAFSLHNLEPFTSTQASPAEHTSSVSEELYFGGAHYGEERDQVSTLPTVKPVYDASKDATMSTSLPTYMSSVELQEEAETPISSVTASGDNLAELALPITLSMDSAVSHAKNMLLTAQASTGNDTCEIYSPENASGESTYVPEIGSLSTESKAGVESAKRSPAPKSPVAVQKSPTAIPKPSTLSKTYTIKPLPGIGNLPTIPAVRTSPSIVHSTAAAGKPSTSSLLCSPGTSQQKQSQRPLQHKRQMTISSLFARPEEGDGVSEVPFAESQPIAGAPRMVLCPETGALVENHDFPDSVMDVEDSESSLLVQAVNTPVNQMPYEVLNKTSIQNTLTQKSATVTDVEKTKAASDEKKIIGSSSVDVAKCSSSSELPPLHNFNSSIRAIYDGGKIVRYEYGGESEPKLGAKSDQDETITLHFTNENKSAALARSKTVYKIKRKLVGSDNELLKKLSAENAALALDSFRVKKPVPPAEKSSITILGTVNRKPARKSVRLISANIAKRFLNARRSAGASNTPQSGLNRKPESSNEQESPVAESSSPLKVASKDSDSKEVNEIALNSSFTNAKSEKQIEVSAPSNNSTSIRELYDMIFPSEMNHVQSHTASPAADDNTITLSDSDSDPESSALIRGTAEETLRQLQANAIKGAAGNDKNAQKLSNSNMVCDRTSIVTPNRGEKLSDASSSTNNPGLQESSREAFKEKRQSLLKSENKPNSGTLLESLKPREFYRSMSQTELYTGIMEAEKLRGFSQLDIEQKRAAVCKILYKYYMEKKPAQLLNIPSYRAYLQSKGSSPVVLLKQSSLSSSTSSSANTSGSSSPIDSAPIGDAEHTQSVSDCLDQLTETSKPKQTSGPQCSKDSSAENGTVSSAEQALTAAAAQKPAPSCGVQQNRMKRSPVIAISSSLARAQQGAKAHQTVTLPNRLISKDQKIVKLVFSSKSGSPLPASIPRAVLPHLLKSVGYHSSKIPPHVNSVSIGTYAVPQKIVDGAPSSNKSKITEKQLRVDGNSIKLVVQDILNKSADSSNSVNEVKSNHETPRNHLLKNLNSEDKKSESLKNS